MNQTSHVLQAIAHHAVNSPTHPALETFDSQINYASLHKQIHTLACQLKHASCQRIAILMDNNPAVAVCDLAVLAAGMVCVPIPLFFSQSQVRHLLNNAGVDTLITDMPAVAEAQFDHANIHYNIIDSINIANAHIFAFRLFCPTSALPKGCSKITYTSGSTGEPKGVCLSQFAMEQVAQSLCQASAASADERHLAMLPFATLLENIGGLYTVMLSGATLLIPPLAVCGLQGSSSLNIARFVEALHRGKVTSCILIPQMLQALLMAIQQGASRPDTLRYVAVGGAPVAPDLLVQAAALGVPAYEGYGLSEAASVLAVNSPTASRSGSVGQLLPHVRILFADDGEILVAGSIFLGYLGEKNSVKDYLPTGDIGHMDDDGYLYLEGRKKHIFITAFGRNVSPEWVERELLLEPDIMQVCIFGEARPFNTAVVVPRGKVSADSLHKAIQRANQRLPDYARIFQWVVADTPFSIENGLWTGTARPRRKKIWSQYQSKLESLYLGKS